MKKNNLNERVTRQKGWLREGGWVKVLAKKIFSLAILSGLILAALVSLKKSPYFRIDNVKVIDRMNAAELDENELLKTYKTKNIFDIDIASFSSQIKNDYPAIKDAIVKRNLPNNLEIEIVPRIPIAEIRTHKGLFIDKEGMVLSPKMQTGPLPVIKGLLLWMRPRTGQIIKNKELESAISVIEALKESTVSSDYNVSQIEASNYRNISFYLENGIEVKIGDGDFLNRLKKLKETFANPNLDKANIKYIDLRFKDVVIGPK